MGRPDDIRAWVLDLWEGNGEGFTSDEGRTLAIAASVLGLGMR